MYSPFSNPHLIFSWLFQLYPIENIPVDLYVYIYMPIYIPYIPYIPIYIIEKPYKNSRHVSTDSTDLSQISIDPPCFFVTSSTDLGEI